MEPRSVEPPDAESRRTGRLFVLTATLSRSTASGTVRETALSWRIADNEDEALGMFLRYLTVRFPQRVIEIYGIDEVPESARILVPPGEGAIPPFWGERYRRCITAIWEMNDPATRAIIASLGLHP